MKSTKKIALCIIIFMMHNAVSSAQVNLVANPGFEEISSCPNDAGQIDLAIGWNTLMNGGGEIRNYFIFAVQPPLFVVCH